MIFRNFYNLHANIKSCKYVFRCRWGLLKHQKPGQLGIGLSVRAVQGSNKIYCPNHNQSVEEEFNAIEDDNISKFQLKEILYPKDLSDVHLERINQTQHPNAVLEIYSRYKDVYKTRHMVQIIIILWNYWRNRSGSADAERLPIPSESFLIHLSNFIDEMNINEITSCYLYLKKIGVDWSHPTMERLLFKALYIISNEDDISLSALSRLLVAINTNRQFCTYLVSKDILPHIENAIDSCTSSEEIRLITICLHNLNQILSHEIVDSFKNKVQSMIDSKIIDKHSVKCILKMLNFLNVPNWSQSNSELIRNLLLLISNNIENLNAKEIELLYKIFQSQLEPAVIGPKLLEASEKFLRTHPTPEMLSCVVQIIQPDKREPLTKILREMLDDKKYYEDSNNFLYFFQALRSLKISDMKLCNLYWEQVLNEVNMIKDVDDYRILRYSHRYMHFNNNLGGTYRHPNFEKKLSSLIMTDITQGLSKIIPSRFARLAPFIIAYGHTIDGNTKIPEIIMNKIESMQKQFSISDCFHLSRGIQIALEMRLRHNVSSEVAAQFVKLESIFASCADHHLDSNQLTLGDVSMIARSLNNRKAARKTIIYKKALEKYNFVFKGNLNSRLIRDITFNLSTSNHTNVDLYQEMFAYITKNKDYVTGDTVEKVVFSAYNLGIGYIPQNTLDAFVDIMKRDFNYMTGLSIVQSCLALCFYKTLPDDLINKVFSVDFIKRVEDEIQICYSKATYPERVLNQVMQLNRAVCLDFPEIKVPWFQQNYIEAQMCKRPIIKDKINTDLKRYLTNLVQDEKYLRCNHITPYGYRIDFVIHFDKNRRPIHPPAETTLLDRITKVAILLLKLDSYSENSLGNLKGPEHLRTRHLEMMGFKVIHINANDWNSMYMNVPGAKENYLKCLLQISDAVPKL